MISSVRHELLDVLRELSEEVPDVRFGQLILNLSYMARGTEDDSAWEIEDAELLEFAKQHLTVWKARQAIPV
ncbi:MAG: hypothetical protein EXS09_13345 [Gemmataceae bacterium]|nr:hypothetical protein [Gemmataceae bacterium]